MGPQGSLGGADNTPVRPPSTCAAPSTQPAQEHGVPGLFLLAVAPRWHTATSWAPLQVATGTEVPWA